MNHWIDNDVCKCGNTKTFNPIYDNKRKDWVCKICDKSKEGIIEPFIIRVARKAYQEGRQDQYIDDFPDIGPHYTEVFEDSNTYKELTRLIKLDK